MSVRIVAADRKRIKCTNCEEVRLRILVLNGGSSTLKAMLYETAAGVLGLDPAPPVWEARVEWGRNPGTADIALKTKGRDAVKQQVPITAPDAVLRPVLESLWTGDAKVVEGPRDISAVGHRVVHGGKAFRESTRIRPEVKAEIARLVEYAPEHNRLELEAIEASEKILGPETPQFAVFDTAFHSTLAPEAYTYPGPKSWLDEGIRRYGFHGISHQYISRRAAEIVGRPLESLKQVTCHLGNGASLAAVDGGKSIDTTMGFTPVAGLMMGSRSGTIDPGIIIHLVRHCGYKADELDAILNKRSGLKGLSCISGDMRDIEAAIEKGNADAKLAFDVYIHRLCQEVGSMVTSLGGLDVLVFSAGIGENSAAVRRSACEKLNFLGVRIDEAKNAASPQDTDVSGDGSAVRVVIVHTEEDWEIARECARLLGPAQGA